MKFIFLIFALCSFSLVKAQYADPCTEIPILNQQILKAIEPYKGKKIYRGECWDAIQFALNETKAKWDGLSVFGRIIDLKTECIQPGDIVWLQKIELSVKTNNGTYTESFPNHYAIVYSVKGSGEIEIIHQNNGFSGKKMGVSTFNFNTIVSKKGTVTIYRPEQN